MQSTDYSMICDKILTSTMQYIDTTNMHKYKMKKQYFGYNQDVLYTDAIYDPAPITLVYTPAGTGKSALISNRINAINQNGVPYNKIAVLNMNIAKTKIMQHLFPEVNIMTFNDFTHGLFKANYPACELTNIQSVINLIRISDNSKSANDLIARLSISNIQDRLVTTTLFANANMEYMRDIITTINRSTHALESIVCMNDVYQFKNNPYDIETIIINSVQNMPLPVLCTILQYANRYHCNLYITGSPNESIYEFNMAYGNAMNILSSYTNKGINVIRLKERIMKPGIINMLDMIPNASIDDVDYAIDICSNEDTINDSICTRFNPDNPYIAQKLDSHLPIMILARSKQDVAKISRFIRTEYPKKYPHIKINDLTMPNPHETQYGSMAIKYMNQLKTRYPNGISIIQYLYELYNIAECETNQANTIDIKSEYEYDKNNLKALFDKYMSDNDISPTKMHTVSSIIYKTVQAEADVAKQYLDMINRMTPTVIDNDSITISTIHAAVDLRCDNVIVFMHNKSDHVDKNLYRVALSRANNTEYIIFANAKPFETPYQQYLKAKEQTS